LWIFRKDTSGTKAGARAGRPVRNRTLALFGDSINFTVRLNMSGAGLELLPLAAQTATNGDWNFHYLYTPRTVRPVQPDR